MMTLSPTPSEIFQLAEIRRRESNDDYSLPPINPPYATASGAYQFIRGTWRLAASNTGIGDTYLDAFLAPPIDQDANALWLLRRYGANSSRAWKASGPYPALDEITAALAAVAGHTQP